MGEFKDEALKLLKLDLGISHDKRDELLKVQISAAYKMLEKNDIKLNEADEGDLMLLVMYSAYLHERRKNPELAMPQSLRYALNCRIVHNPDVPNLGTASE